MLKLSRLTCENRLQPNDVVERQPVFGWQLSSDHTNVMQAARHLQVAVDRAFGQLLWDTDWIVDSQSIQIVYEGQPLSEDTLYFWRVRVRDQKGHESGWSEPEVFMTASFSFADWPAAFISPETPEDGGLSRGYLLRKSFQLKRVPQQARLYATALGIYQLTVNGKPVTVQRWREGEHPGLIRQGDRVPLLSPGERSDLGLIRQAQSIPLLSPGWSAYEKRLQVQVFDVAGLLQAGENVIGVQLGNGWWKGNLAGWMGKRNRYGQQLAFAAELRSRAGGASDWTRMVTDESWRAADGPVQMAEFYQGETYDARLEQDGWDEPGFKAAGWRPVAKVDFDRAKLVGQSGPPVLTQDVLPVLKEFKTPKGERVLDFGQNIAGFVRFRVRGKAGDEVLLRHAEVLDVAGNFYTENYRSAKSEISYTLRGGGVEEHWPLFTTQGFRYVQVVKWPGKLNPADLEAVVVHSELPEAGGFTCSDERLNQLMQNIRWGMKGNFIEVPTDCPQRDERLGWTGDAQVFARTALFLAQAGPFFARWLQDMAAEQRADGAIPVVIPDAFVSRGEGASCGWSDAATIIPWAVYLTTGDRRTLERAYPMMRAWVGYIRARAENEVLWNTGSHYADWVALDAPAGSYVGATPADLMATAYYAHSTELLVRAATLLGRTADVADFGQLLKKIRAAFAKEFFTTTGRLVSPTQTAHAVALQFGLVPARFVARTVRDLLRLLEKADWHLTTGFLGTPALCFALAEQGQTEAAYKLLLQDTYPSWLYPLTQGATTIWEHWDGIKPDGTMWSANMNSFNHYAYGAIGEFMQRRVAGLDFDPAGPGYQLIRFQPLPGGGLTHAEAWHDSPLGRTAIRWQVTAGADTMLTVQVDVPPNARARLELPEGTIHTFGSGRREFTSRMPLAK